MIIHIVLKVVYLKSTLIIDVLTLMSAFIVNVTFNLYVRCKFIPSSIFHITVTLMTAIA